MHVEASQLRAAVVAHPWRAVATAWVLGASLGLAERARGELARAAATATRGMLLAIARDAFRQWRVARTIQPKGA